MSTAATTRVRNPATEPSAAAEGLAGRATAVLLGAGALGFSAMLTQLVMMRELVTVFSGNEVVFGVSLAAWLFLTGGGTALGRWASAWLGADGPTDPPPVASRTLVGLGCGLVAAAAVPLAEVVAVRGLRDVFFAPGAAVGIGGMVMGCTLALAPFCLVSGALLTLACGALAECGVRNGPGRVYAADAAGAVAGGACFAFVLASALDHFAVLVVGGMALQGAAALLGRHGAGRAVMATAVLAALGVLVIPVLDADRRTTQWQYAGEVVWCAGSPYGRIVVTRQAGQLTYFNHGTPIATRGDAAAEETAHYAMALRPNARRVLVIGGTPSGAIREVLRHPVERVVAIELDPAVLAAVRAFDPEALGDRRALIVVEDARRFVQRTVERFDVVLLDVGEPATLQLNRFFTAEFLGAVKRVLGRDGLVATGVGRYQNFVSADLAGILGVTHATLRWAFREVRMIPGGRVYFVGSDSPLAGDIAAQLEGRGFELRLVNRHYLDAMLAPDRLAELERAVASPSPVNRDFTPVLYYRHLRHWLGQFGRFPATFEFLLAAALAGYLALLPAVPRVVFAAGFAGAALEVIVLLAFQVSYGALYQQLGLVVTVFMAGLAAGAAWSARRAEPAPGNRLLVRLSWVLGVLAAVLAVLPEVGLPAAGAPAWVGQAALLGFTGLLGGCVGAQLPLAGAVSAGGATQIASRLFGADWLGAAAGALCVSTWLLPALGFGGTCALTAALNFVAAALLSGRTPRAA